MSSTHSPTPCLRHKSLDDLQQRSLTPHKQNISATLIRSESTGPLELLDEVVEERAALRRNFGSQIIYEHYGEKTAFL